MRCREHLLLVAQSECIGVTRYVREAAGAHYPSRQHTHSYAAVMVSGVCTDTLTEDAMRQMPNTVEGLLGASLSVLFFYSYSLPLQALQCSLGNRRGEDQLNPIVCCGIYADRSDAYAVDTRLFTRPNTRLCTSNTITLRHG